MKKFYITTPIYYPSGKPHIGHAYSTILADVYKRYKQLIGYQTFFCTGTDEHGKKIELAAKQNNLSTMEYVNKNVDIFVDLWKKLGIKYDFFVRTTNKHHIATVQKIFSFYLSKDLIYLSDWSSLYCISCEENYTTKEAIKKHDQLFCQHGHELIVTNEESYFFRMSQFENWIRDYLLTHQDFVLPESRVNELVNNFLSDNLKDLSISRTSFKWGIPIKENNQHVIYVWMDALFNYITSLGFKSNNEQLFKTFWLDQDCEKVHLLSKEITRFHCIYWPIFLHVLNLPLPNKIISHGWIITPEGKMSKSLGNVIDPFILLEKYNREMLRYYFIKDMSLHSDNIFSLETMIGTYNGDLANNYGNLISRSLGMLNKYCNNVIPKYQKNKLYDAIIEELFAMNKQCYVLCDQLDIQSLLNKIQQMINILNKTIEEQKPWELFKFNKYDEINALMYILFKVIESVSFWLQPILIDSISTVIQQTNIPIDKLVYEDLFNLDSLKDITCNFASPIFIRFKLEEN